MPETRCVYISVSHYSFDQQSLLAASNKFLVLYYIEYLISCLKKNFLRMIDDKLPCDPKNMMILMLKVVYLYFLSQ